MVQKRRNRGCPEKIIDYLSTSYVSYYALNGGWN